MNLGGAFRGRSVFVTGHTGFKGSWLTLWLERLGARVTGYSLPPAGEPSHFAGAGVRELLRDHHENDIRDRRALRAALDAAAPHVVFHLAAQPLVRESYARPQDTFEINVMGTVALLEAVRETGAPVTVVVVTSDKCYRNESEAPCREDDPLGGRDPYSASKAAAELAVAAYRSSFFDRPGAARVASARAGNVIGGGDWAADRIVPDCIRALSAGRTIAVRNPEFVRPWQHVLEPLAGYLLLAARLQEEPGGAFAEAWNFGPGPASEASVRVLVQELLQAWGTGSWEAMAEERPPAEAHALRLGIDKAAAHLGWRPRWTLRETVDRVVRWYRRHLECGPRPGALRDASLADIADYDAA